MSVGSILGAARENSVVWGSGIISRSTTFRRPFKITAVRGPYSREVALSLGYDCPDVYGDPALLLPLLYKPQHALERKPLGIVPHISQLDDARQWASEHADVVRLIDVRFPIEQIIEEVVSCTRIVSSSLHGLVLAHAYGVPAGWATFGGPVHEDDVKYLDHYASLSISTPACLSDTLRMSPARLMEFAEDQALPDPAPLLTPLMKACPFPIGAGRRELLAP